MNNKKFILLILLVAFSMSCAVHQSPMAYLYRNRFADLRVENKEKIKESSIKVEIPLLFNEVWKSALVVLGKYAIVPKLSLSGEGSGTISYIDVDALVHGGKPFSIDMPFTVFIEEELVGTTIVYVYPRNELVEGRYPPEKMETIREGMTQNGKQFLNRLITQALARKKWEWLRSK